MQFTKSKLEMIYKYEATTKEDTVKAMKETLPSIDDQLTYIIIRNAAEKLEKLPESCIPIKRQNMTDNCSGIKTGGSGETQENKPVNTAEGQKTGYVGADTHLPPYLSYPRFLLKMDIAQTARLLYALLLDRTTLSQRNGWQDESGRDFPQRTTLYVKLPPVVQISGLMESENPYLISPGNWPPITIIVEM